MIVPIFNARIKERLRVDTRKVDAFVGVAPITGQRKVSWIIVPAMLAWHDVLYLEG